MRRLDDGRAVLVGTGRLFGDASHRRALDDDAAPAQLVHHLSAMPLLQRLMSAQTPVGAVAGRAVFVDVSLASKPDVVFSAGTHLEAIAVRWADFARTVKPIVGNFAAPPTDRVPAYRLSYRE